MSTQKKKVPSAHGSDTDSRDVSLASTQSDSDGSTVDSIHSQIPMDDVERFMKQLDEDEAAQATQAAAAEAKKPRHPSLQRLTPGLLEKEMKDNAELLRSLRADEEGVRLQMYLKQVPDKVPITEDLYDFSCDIGIICRAAKSVVTYAEVHKALSNAVARSQRIELLLDKDPAHLRLEEKATVVQIKALQAQHKEALKYYERNCQSRKRNKVNAKRDLIVRISDRDFAARMLPSIPAYATITTSTGAPIEAVATKKKEQKKTASKAKKEGSPAPYGPPPAVQETPVARILRRSAFKIERPQEKKK